MQKVKKHICLFLIIFMSLVNTSCSKNKQEKEDASKDSFEIKIATNVLDTYMKYLVKEDIENAEKLCSNELLQKEKSIGKTDLKIYGYKTDEVNEVGRSGLFKVKVSRSVPGKCSATLDLYSVKIEKQQNDYKITDVNSNTEKDALVENDGIRVREKNNVKTSLLLDTSGIPLYIYPKNDKAKINKVSVPRTNFGVANFSYGGDRIAVSTFDKDTYIGIVKIDETMLTQGGSGGSGGASGDKSAGGGASGTGVNIKIKEVPVGKEITSLDLITDAKIDLMCFSLEEKYIVAQYDKTSFGKSIRVYDADSGELIPTSFEEKFPLGKVDVVFSSFDKEALNFEVKEKGATDKNTSQMIGKWQLSLKDYKIKKL